MRVRRDGYKADRPKERTMKTGKEKRNWGNGNGIYKKGRVMKHEYKK